MKHIVPTTNTVIILLFFIFCYIGCGFLDEEYKYSPNEIHILSISDSRPAEIKIGITVFADGCSSTLLSDPVTAERDGNNIYIYLTGTRTRLSLNDESGYCPSIVVEQDGELTVKNLEVGEYTIKVDNLQALQSAETRFRIEPDTAYKFIEPRHPNFIIEPIASNNDEQKEGTYRVTTVLHLNGCSNKTNCEPIIKTDIERTQDVINIEVWEVIPNTECQIIGRYERNSIDLGTFSIGSYTAIINDITYTFEVPPFTN